MSRAAIGGFRRLAIICPYTFCPFAAPQQLKCPYCGHGENVKLRGYVTHATARPERTHRGLVRPDFVGILRRPKACAALDLLDASDVFAQFRRAAPRFYPGVRTVVSLNEPYGAILRRRARAARANQCGAPHR